MKRLLTFLLMALVLGIGACASDLEKRTVRMGKTGDFEVSELKRTEVNGLLRVQIQVENTGNAKPVSYRFQWLDAKGFVVGSVEAWKPLPIEKGRHEVVEGVAPAPEAKDFKFELNSY